MKLYGNIYKESVYLVCMDGKNLKRFLVFGVFVLFTVSMMSGVFAKGGTYAGENDVVSFADRTAAKIMDPVKDMFASWGEGDLSQNVAKYLFTILLVLLIYSVTTLMPLLGDRGPFIQWTFSVIVAFLSVAYLTPAEVYTILLSYGAMGIVMGGLIPVVILVFFTLEVEKKNPKAGVMITPLVWMGFIFFIVYKTIVGMASKSNPLQLGEGLVYLGIIVIALLFLLFKKKILKLIFKGEINVALSEGKKDLISSLIGEVSRRNRDKPSTLSGGAEKSYDKKTAKLEKQIEKLSK